MIAAIIDVLLSGSSLIHVAGVFGLFGIFEAMVQTPGDQLRQSRFNNGLTGAGHVVLQLADRDRSAVIDVDHIGRLGALVTGFLDQACVAWGVAV